MIKINILTNNTCPNSRAFNFPLIRIQSLCAIPEIDFNFHQKISAPLFKADVIFLNSNYFRPWWDSRKDDIFRFLEKLHQTKVKIIWFDTTDSTWCTQFEALPYVNLFLKSQIYKDKKQYLKTCRTGRIFTDYFDNLYSSDERTVSYPPASEKYLHKIDISWNTCYECYTPDRYSFYSKIKRRIASLSGLLSAGTNNVSQFIQFGDSQRVNDISCRIGLSHDRPSVVAHRRHIAEIMEKRGVNCTKIPLDAYFEELRTSKIGVGPFGVGEITIRDFEIILCGAVLLKPDMSHMKTWPELFVSGTTCETHAWDLSDMNEKIDFLLANPDYMKTLADNAYNRYTKVLSDEGFNIFAERIKNFINRLN